MHKLIIFVQCLISSQLAFGFEITSDKYYYDTNSESITAQISDFTTQGYCIIEVKKNPEDATLLSEKLPFTNDKSLYSKTLDIKKLQQGRYLLVGEFFTKDNESIGKQISVFFKKDSGYETNFKEHNKIDIRDDGIILLNDEPFCPFFSSFSLKPLPAIKNAFNVRFGEEGLVDRPLERIDPGLPWITEKDNEIFVHLPGEEELLHSITSNVLKQYNTPYLFYWFLKYEADIPMYRTKTNKDGSIRIVSMDNRNELKRVNKLIKALDPNHLTTVHIDTPALIDEYKDIADVLEIASGHGEGDLSSYSVELIPNLIDNVDTIKRKLGSIPFFFWIGSSIPAPEHRTAEEIRCGTYLTLMHGAAGIIFHMGHESIPQSDTRHLSVYSGLAKEIDTFFPVLTSQIKIPKLDVQLSQTSIDYCIRQYNKKTYLFAVNTTGEFMDCEVTIKAPKALAKKINVLFENRNVKISNNKFMDFFSKYEPHVYEISY